MPTENPRALRHVYRSSLARLEGTSPSRRARSGDRQSVTLAAGEVQGPVDPRRPLGRRGEDLALAHFRALGFKPLARNQHRRFGEIDLLMYDGHTLVFAEVKTRHVRKDFSGAQDSARETLGWPSIAQFKRSRRALRRWLNEQGSDHPVIGDLRLDVIRVLLDENDNPVKLDHIEAAWEGAF